MKWVKSKSFFNKVLFYFGLILVVPVCTILLLYIQAEKTVKEQIQISGHNTLNQFFRAMDIALEEMYDHVISLTMNEECQKYAMYTARGKDTGYQAYATRQDLQTVSAERYEDVFVYFPEDDRVISRDHASLPADYYFRIYFDHQAGKQWEQFQEILGCTSRKPRLYALDDGDGTPLLCMAVQRHYMGDARQDYVAVVSLSPNYLGGLLENDMMFRDGGKFLIYGEERELLFTNGGAEVNLPEDVCGEFITYETRVGRNSYVMQVEHSRVVAGYYAYQVPYEYYWQQLETTRWIYILGLMGCTLISIIVAYRLCSKAYQPVQQIVDKMQKHTEDRYDRLQSSEFEYIEQLFARENERNLSLMLEAKSGRAAVLERFVIQLLDGSVPESAGDGNVFREHGMELYSDRFCVAVIAADTNRYEDILGFILENVFCELLDKRHKGYVVSLPGRKYGILINLRSPLQSEAELQDVLNKGRLVLEEHGNLRLSIGMSRLVEGMMQIPGAYREAEKALRYRYLYEGGCLVEFEQIKNRETQYRTAEESRLFLLLLGYITEESQKLPEDFVAELFPLYGIDREASIETVDGFLTELASTVNVLILSRKYMIPERSVRLEQLTRATTLTDLKKALAELLDFLRQKEAEHAGSRALCDNVKRYIKDHYRDYELSITTLSEQFGISATRLSRLFKETYDVGILDYIARTRVQAGKRELERTEDSVGEIAGRCGFLSSNVFIRTFKKCEGITPGAYRKLMEDRTGIEEL